MSVADGELQNTNPDAFNLQGVSVPRVTRAWYILCQSKELKNKPVRQYLWGVPIVLFRDSAGVAGALLDRCPHRSIPLSQGKVCGDRLQCPYHGWEFERTGECARVPGLVDQTPAPHSSAVSYAVTVQEGFVWVYATPGVEPESRPFSFTKADQSGYVTVRHEVSACCSIHAIAENALDVPHTAYLHGGLFRTASSTNRIRAVLERGHDRAHVEYLGEPRPQGLMGRILAPGGGVVTHFDRFYLPSIVEVEYKIGDDLHLVSYGAATPVSDFETRLFGVVTLKSRFPRWLVRPIIQPLGFKIFGQDARILKMQTEQIGRFKEEKFVSTDLDLLGPHILRLLRRAAQGELEPSDAEPYRKEIEMEV